MIGRRRFLSLAAAGAVLGAAGCAGCPSPVSGSKPGAGTTGGSASAGGALTAVTDVPASPGGPYVIDDLLATPGFYIAHRGSGDNWPEHTMRAYSESVAMGLKAIEVSVSSTADGVLVCHHDLNTERLTGIDLTISRASFAAIEPLRNDARAWLGPATELEPIPRLADVLNEFAASHVIFLEDKQGTNADEIMDVLERHPGAREHIVWKQPAASAGHLLARQRGYTTWGYFSSQDLGRTAELIPDVDMLGIHHTAPEGEVRELVASGKPVIAWEVHRRSERDRLRALGVRGIMCSNQRYVLQRENRLLEDGFAIGRRSPGDLPSKADENWEEQPGFADGGVRLASAMASSYTLGSMGPVRSLRWEVSFEVRWPDGLPDRAAGLGFAFGQDDDAPCRPGVPASQGGYQLDVGIEGTLSLIRRDPGQVSGVQLASSASPPPVAGQWLRLAVAVTPQDIAARRFGEGSSGWSASSQDRGFRGGYFSLLKNYDGGPPLEFRRIAVRETSGVESCPA